MRVFDWVTDMSINRVVDQSLSMRLMHEEEEEVEETQLIQVGFEEYQYQLEMHYHSDNYTSYCVI